MKLVIDARLTSGVVILDLMGRATAGAEADMLRTQMLNAFQHSSRHIVLNCEELAYVDSSAIGEMVAAYSSIVRGGGMVRLVHPHKRMLELLRITHLDRVFETFDNEAKAIASFNNAGGARSQQAMSAFLKDPV